MSRIFFFSIPIWGRGKNFQEGQVLIKKLHKMQYILVSALVHSSFSCLVVLIRHDSFRTRFIFIFHINRYSFIHIQANLLRMWNSLCRNRPDCSKRVHFTNQNHNNFLAFCFRFLIYRNRSKRIILFYGVLLKVSCLFNYRLLFIYHSLKDPLWPQAALFFVPQLFKTIDQFKVDPFFIIARCFNKVVIIISVISE